MVRFGTDVEPLVLAGLRTVFAVVILLPFWLVKGMSVKELKKNGIHLSWLIGAGICLGIHFTLWIASIYYTSVASASVLVTIHPVILIIVESILFKRSFRPIVWIGVFVAFAGSASLGIADHSWTEQYPNTVLGNSLAFCAAVVFVIYFLIGRKIRQHSEWIDYVFHVYFYAAITCAVLSVIWVGGIPHITISSLIVGLALAVGATILGHGAMNYAVKYISPTLLSTLFLFEAVIAAIAAYFIFGEIPSFLSVISMIIIVFGMLLTWSKKLFNR